MTEGEETYNLLDNVGSGNQYDPELGWHEHNMRVLRTERKDPRASFDRTLEMIIAEQTKKGCKP